MNTGHITPQSDHRGLGRGLVRFGAWGATALATYTWWRILRYGVHGEPGHWIYACASASLIFVAAAVATKNYPGWSILAIVLSAVGTLAVWSLVVRFSG